MDKEQITSFREEYFFLSNFYPCNVTIDGITYNNAEAAFQAQKSEDVDIRKAFVGLSGKEAKKLGRKVKLRPHWDDIRIPAMQFVVQQKFRENKDLREKLLNTKDAELIECNTWNDRFWGVCKGKGKNILGKILMDTRSYFNSPMTKIIESLLEEYDGGNENE